MTKFLTMLVSTLAMFALTSGAAEAAPIKDILAGKKLACGYDEFELQPTGSMRITNALDEDIEFVSLPAEIVWKDDQAEFHLTSLGKVYTLTASGGDVKENGEACRFE